MGKEATLKLCRFSPKRHARPPSIQIVAKRKILGAKNSGILYLAWEEMISQQRIGQKDFPANMKKRSLIICAFKNLQVFNLYYLFRKSVLTKLHGVNVKMVIVHKRIKNYEEKRVLAF